MLKKKFSGIIFSIIIISVILMTLSLLSCKCNEFKENLIMLEGLIMFLFSMLQTLIIALLIDKELVKHRSLTEKALDLEEKGITGVNKNGVLTSEEINDLFNNAEIIKLMFVTGNNFLTKYKSAIEKAIKKGKKIRILLANENSGLINDISEELRFISNSDQNINVQKQEIIKIKNMVSSLESCENIEIRQYNSEYRCPIYIGYYSDGKIKVWYNSILPVVEPKKMIMFKGENLNINRSSYYDNIDIEKLNDFIFLGERNDDKSNIVFDLEAHFDYLWNKYDLKEEKNYE